MMPILGNYYPDVLYKMIIVNMGFIFNMIFKAVKMMMHPVTREKIISLSSSKADQKKEFLKYMDIDEIPKLFGGNYDYNV